MTAILLLVSTALAWEGQPGLWLPGATSLGAKTGRAGLGVAWGQNGGESLYGQGIVGATSRLAINVDGALQEGGGGLGLGLRYRALVKDGFALAPYAQFEFASAGTSTYLGLAGAFAGDGATLDASLTLFAAQTYDGHGTVVAPPDALGWFEAGLTFYPAKQQELRLGVLGQQDLNLAVTYRWRGSWWYVEPSLLWWPEDLSAQLGAGVRF